MARVKLPNGSAARDFPEGDFGGLRADFGHVYHFGSQIAQTIDGIEAAGLLCWHPNGSEGHGSQNEGHSDEYNWVANSSVK